MREEKALLHATLCFPVTDASVLLGIKMKKIGAGCQRRRDWDERANALFLLDGFRQEPILLEDAPKRVAVGVETYRL